MSNQALVDVYDGELPSLVVGGGGGGGVSNVNVGPGLVKTGTTSQPIINLGFTQNNQLLYGTGNNAGASLNPGANGDFLRINLSGNLEWHPISAGGVVAVSEAPNNVGYVNNSNTSVPAIGLKFPATQGCIAAGTGVANQGAFTAGLTFPADTNYVLTADNMAATGCSWKALAGSSLVAEAPLIEYTENNVSKIALNFGINAKGQIPVGVSDPGGKLGTITPALTFPADTGKVLTADPDPANLTGVKWEALTGPTGSIQTNDPLVDDFASGNNTISINFTATKGEIPAGSGEAKKGVLLPLGNQGDILSVNTNAPSGMAWVPQKTGGGVIVNRAEFASTEIAPPSTVSDTMILVAEEPGPSFSKYQIPFTQTNDYDIEFFTPYYPNISPLNLPFALYGLIEQINGSRCVALYYSNSTYSGPGGALIGHFRWGNYDSPAFVLCAIAGLGQSLQNCFVLGGCFTHFHNELTGAEIECNSICVVNFSTFSSGTPMPVVENLPYISGSQTTGLTYSSDPEDAYVCQIIPQPTPVATERLLIFGTFDTLNYEDGTTVPGFLSCAVYNYDIGNSAYISVQDTFDVYGLGLSQGLNAAGNIQDVIYDSVRGFFLFVGFFLSGKENFGTDYQFDGGNDVGFAKLTWGAGGPAPSGSRWNNTPVTTLGAGSAYCIRLSQSLTGGDKYLLSNANQGQPVSIYDATANTITAAPMGATPVGVGDASCFFNSIAGATNFDLLGTGSPANFDVVLYVNRQDPPSQIIVYFTGNSTTSVALPPTPTGVVPIFGGGTQPINFGVSPYGINISGLGDPAAPATLNIGGAGAVGQSQQKGSIYTYDPSTVANLDFTFADPTKNKFIYDGAAKSTARFSTAATLPQSQSYVASKDLTSWIQVGASTTSLTYIP